MSNVLTPLIPNMTTAILPVLYEQAPLPRICMGDFRAKEASLNEAVIIPTAPPVAGVSRTPAAIFTQAADRTIISTSITLTKDKTYPFYMTGDDYHRARQNPDYVPASFKEALRALRNDIHADLVGLHVAAAGYYNAVTPSSGASVGTAGTTPFAADISAATNAEKLLNDSLAPVDDNRFLLIDTAAKAKMGTLPNLIQVYQAGTDDLLRKGLLGMVAGFNVAWANNVPSWTPGTGAGYVTSGVQAAGQANVVLITGAGTVLAGDVVTFAGDLTQYVVGAGIASPGTIVLTSNLVNAVANGVAMTIVGASRRNLAFHRQALGLAVRVPAMPPGGTDMAIESEIIADPVSGFPVRVAHYMGYGLDQWEIQAVWGTKAVRPSLLKLVLG